MSQPSKRHKKQISIAQNILITLQKTISKIIKYVTRPPQPLTKKNLKIYYAKKLRAEYRALKFIDAIMFLFVSSNVFHLSYVFGKGVHGVVSILTAAAFAFAELFLARAIGRAIEAKRSAVFLWVSLCSVLFLTIGFNLIYDLHLNRPYANFDSSIVVFDYVVWFLAIGGSGMISLMIVGLSYTRVIQNEICLKATNELNNFSVNFDKKEKNRIRQAQYRQRQYKKIKDAKKQAGV